LVAQSAHSMDLDPDIEAGAILQLEEVDSDNKNGYHPHVEMMTECTWKTEPWGGETLHATRMVLGRHSTTCY
jgi:hypothetical protein